MVAPRFDAPPEEDPRPATAWWGWHVARYAYAARQLRAGRVLDVACGTGYGLTVLSPVSSGVVGVDVDVPALDAARSHGPVLAADGGTLPFPAATFDAVVSFETLEHLTQRAAFLAELRRVMKAGSTLVLSTPNAHYSQPVDGRPTNPFHMYEYTPDELVAEMEPYFEIDALIGQEISDRWVISPFWDDQQRYPRTARNRARVFTWRVVHKLPRGVRDTASRALWRHPLFPGPDDYTFDTASLATARTTVVVARPRETVSI